MSLELSDLKKWFNTHKQEIFSRFFTFLKFGSVGTDPAYRQETRKCAQWIVDYLKQIGFQSTLYETSVHPIVYGEYMHAGKEQPTLLIYHHYDVQPVDPLDLWKSGPFEPTIKEGQVYARGAQDNKGQCFYTLTALHAFLQLCKEAKINLKLFIEGEEESGSVGTTQFLKEKGELLKADYLLVIDSGIPGPGVPAITMGLRGIVTMEVTLTNSAEDLHSGSHGGVVLNPNRALVQLLAKLWDKEGKVAVPHFYDNVKKYSETELAKFEMSFDKKDYEKKFGVKAYAIEPGFSPSESNYIRPVLEINGMSGGYAGKGFKTVIPSMAVAKISCRLVPYQDPEKIFHSIANFLRAEAPKGIDLKVEEYHGAAAFGSSFDSPIVKMVSKAYEEVLGKPCRYMLMGGSIPIVGELSKVSGAAVVVMGYGLDDDKIHAPNEHFGLDRFEQGFLTVARILNHFQHAKTAKK
ncbi:MAG TPA: dipeptidase [Rhabdochlamydiaceae bacterium]|nr:dipeptidase [Rhabdochlamydiaceae bacterium]